MTGRTKRQDALLTSPAAWGWWTDGYENGWAQGYLAGINAAAGVLAEHAPYKDAGALLVSAMNPEVGRREAAARAHRAQMLAPARPVETPEQRHARCADSWGLPKEGAA